MRVEFLPKNTSTLIQPMNQGVITTFKAQYLRRTLNQLAQEMGGADRSLYCGGSGAATLS